MAEQKRKYWLHRITGGENGRILSYPLLRDHNLLSIGWSFISSEELAKDIQVRGKIAIREAYEAEGATWSRSTSSLLNFVNGMHEGDIVVVPMGAYLNIYRLADERVLANDTIPDEYLEESKIIKKSDGLYTQDGQYIDLGFYRLAVPIILNIPRSQANNDLYKKTKAFLTNINITDVSKSVEKLIPSSQQDRSVMTLSGSNTLSDLVIKNYKNIDNLHLSDLRQVNLFIGKNNVGKSNLLEAISLYINNWNLDSLLHILSNRKERTDDFTQSTFNQSENNLLRNFAPILPKRDINFLKRNTNNEVVIGGNKHFLHLALMNAYYRKDAETEANRLYQLTPFANRITKISSNAESVLAVVDKEDSNSTASVVKQEVSTKTINLIQLTNNGLNYITQENKQICRLVNCKSLSTEMAQNLWAEFSLTNREDEIIGALKLIDERIEDFNFVNIGNRIVPLVKISQDVDGIKQSVRMPVSELGDGLVHVLNIIIALLGCQDGVLLLDEVESGLHYMTQMNLWRMIFELSKDNRVQIFATTHSNDCINAFVRNTEENQGIMYRLDKHDDGIIATTYSDPSRIAFALDENIDLR